MSFHYLYKAVYTNETGSREPSSSAPLGSREPGMGVVGTTWRPLAQSFAIDSSMSGFRRVWPGTFQDHSVIRKFKLFYFQLLPMSLFLFEQVLAL